MKVNSKLTALIGQRLEKRPAEIEEQSRLAEDLGMSVVKFARLIKDVDDEYHISISKDEMRQIETVGDLQATVERHLAR